MNGWQFICATWRRASWPRRTVLAGYYVFAVMMLVYVAGSYAPSGAHAVLVEVFAPVLFLLGTFLLLSYKGVQEWIDGKGQDRNGDQGT